MFLYRNYLVLLGECGRLEEALRYGRRAIQLSVQCQQGYLAASVLEVLSDIYHQLETSAGERNGALCKQYADWLKRGYLQKKI